MADLRQAAGLLVRRVQTEPETDPPRACIAFTSAPSRRADFHPQDWVRLDPPAARVGHSARGFVQKQATFRSRQVDPPADDFAGQSGVVGVPEGTVTVEMSP